VLLATQRWSLIEELSYGACGSTLTALHSDSVNPCMDNGCGSYWPLPDLITRAQASSVCPSTGSFLSAL